MKIYDYGLHLPQFILTLNLLYVFEDLQNRVYFASNKLLTLENILHKEFILYVSIQFKITQRHAGRINLLTALHESPHTSWK